VTFSRRNPLSGHKRATLLLCILLSLPAGTFAASDARTALEKAVVLIQQGELDGAERQARIDGIPVSVTKHLIRANPRAVMENETDGIIKLLSDPDDGTVLGGAMVGLRASEVITTVALAVHAKLGVQALAETAAVNPSMSESLQRTAEKAAEGMLGVSRVTLTS